MNAPMFDVSRLPADPRYGYMEAVIAEQRRVCGPIDERIIALEKEFYAMVEQVNSLKLNLDTTKGFFARWKVRRQMKRTIRRVDDNRSMRDKLTMERWQRTYGS